MSTPAVYYSILEAVQAGLKEIELDGIEDANILLAKVQNERETVFPGLPGILVLPFGAESIVATQGTNNRDDIGYPVGVICFAQDRQQSYTGLPTAAAKGTQDEEYRFEPRLLWRQQIRQKFINQRLVLTDTTPSKTNRCTVEPMQVIDPRDWLEDNIWTSGLVFRFWTREVRG
jgi:hypothetical protein